MATGIAWERGAVQEGEAELHVVAFYESFRAGEWAKELFDRIRRRAPRETTAIPGLWRFDTLENPHFREMAATDAVDAAVIIVAAQGTRPLPAPLLECIEDALGKRGPARVGLVAVLEESEHIGREKLPSYRQLQGLCRNARVRFFSLPCRNLALMPVEETFRLASNRLLDPSLSIEIRSDRGWGINE